MSYFQPLCEDESDGQEAELNGVTFESVNGSFGRPYRGVRDFTNRYEAMKTMSRSSCTF